MKYLIYHLSIKNFEAFLDLTHHTKYVHLSQQFVFINQIFEIFQFFHGCFFNSNLSGLFSIDSVYNNFTLYSYGRSKCTI